MPRNHTLPTVHRTARQAVPYTGGDRLKSQEIKAVSYVHMEDKLVSTQELNAAQKEQLGVWLKTSYLNTLFQGQAVFTPPEIGQNDDPT